MSNGEHGETGPTANLPPRNELTKFQKCQGAGWGGWPGKDGDLCVTYTRINVDLAEKWYS